MATVLANTWWLFVADRFGTEFVIHHFQEELINRFKGTSITSGHKPWHYYLTHAPGALLPGSLLLLPLLSTRFRDTLRSQRKGIPERDRLLRFCCSTTILSIILLSLSTGKSNRYLMPLYPLVAIIFTHLGIALERHWNRFHFQKALLLLCSLIFLSRVPMAAVIAPSRNAKDSVSQIAAALVERAAESDNTIYVLEMFERWVPFYLQKKGITVSRLTPENTRAMKEANVGKKLLLLINVEDEEWRLSQLPEGDSTVTVVEEFATRKHRWKLLKIPANLSWQFNPEPLIPTRPTLPSG
jgi:4-amino-4-deoxy-L-arabinose transferase-like glycosyltransferase